MAARPHGSTGTSRDWSVDPSEPYWRTNTSFSPPASRWDYPFQSEGVPYGSLEHSHLYGSSASSNSKDSMNWVRSNYLCNPTSDGAGLLLGSPDISQGPQWTPPAIQAISMDDYETPTNKGNYYMSVFASLHC